MQGVLASLKVEDLSFMGKGAGFDEFKSIVGFETWSSIEESPVVTSCPLLSLPK
jgi:hypothetical protein